MKVLELIIDEKDLKGGINAVSVVEAPAIEENFVALAKHEVELKEIDTEKRILMGAALIPNKKIYRRNKEEEFYIYFSEDTVRRAMELFFINGNQSSATFEHKKAITGMTAVESWLIEDEKMDKSQLYGFNLPKGTWMISMKVDNDEVWQDVKDGKIKGFSIEGYFADKMPDSPRQDMERNEIINQLKDLLK
jgi:phage head maturation protease